MKTALLLSALSLALLSLHSGCKREAETPPSASSGAQASKGTEKAGPAGGAAVGRIVFIDKEKCCDCTRKRIDASWKALTDLVGFPPVPDVERIHLDSQAARAEPYAKQKAIVVPPAIYFFDKQGKLLEVLQGEVKSTQIKKALGGSK